jgi:serine/threonine-protein kinase
MSLPPLPIPERIGRYRIDRKIGEGGMGVVYAARDERLDRTVALKTIRGDGDDTARKRLWREARAAAGITHPNICQLYEIDESDDGLVLAMELLDGEPLSALVRRGRLGEAAAIALARGVCSALTAAHAKNIVHRDLKPDNIFLVPDPDAPLGVRPKLLDFGIAKLSEMGMADSATKTGAVMGTPTYMSPEQCSGKGQIDHRADLYSLGCVLYELVAGRPPFVSVGAGELIGQHLFVPPESPRQHAPEISTGLEQIIMALLAKNPADRPGSAAELAQRLDEAARGGGGALGTGAPVAYDAARTGALTPAHLTPLPPPHLTPGHGGPGAPLMAPHGQAPSAPPLGAMGSSPAVLGGVGRSGPEAQTMATPYSLQLGGPPGSSGGSGPAGQGAGYASASSPGYSPGAASGAMPPLPAMPWPQGAQAVAPGGLGAAAPRRGSRRVLAVILGGLLVGGGVAAAVVLGGGAPGGAPAGDTASDAAAGAAGGAPDAALPGADGAGGAAVGDSGAATISGGDAAVGAGDAAVGDGGAATSGDGGVATGSNGGAAVGDGGAAAGGDAGAPASTAPTAPSPKDGQPSKPKPRPRAKPKSDVPSLIEDDI